MFKLSKIYIINSDLKWKPCGAVAGKSSKVTLPENFNEIYVYVWIRVNNIMYSSIGIIPISNINPNELEIFYLSGGYMNGDSRSCRIYIDKLDTVQLCSLNQDGIEYDDGACMGVYYR